MLIKILINMWKANKINEEYLDRAVEQNKITEQEHKIIISIPKKPK